MSDSPYVFIGIGGSGVTTLAHVKRLLRTAFGVAATDRRFRFLLIDTDESAYADLRKRFSTEFNHDDKFIDRDKEWIGLGAFNPHLAWLEATRNAREPKYAGWLSWLNPDSAARFPNRVADAGAEANRQLGRFALANNLERVVTALNDTLASVNAVRADAALNGPMHIYVVTSSCGGTGSSTFFDLLLTLAVLYQRMGQAAPKLRAVIYSPQPFIRRGQAHNMPEELLGRWAANSCAFFRELQYAFEIQSSGKTIPASAFVQPNWPELGAFKAAWEPFEAGIIVDAQTEGSTSFIPFDRLYPAVAELLLYLSLSGAKQKVDSFFVNCSRGDRSTVTQTFPRYMTGGYRAIEYPARFLEPLVGESLSCQTIAELTSRREPGDSEIRNRAKEIAERVFLKPFRSDSADCFERQMRERYISHETTLLREVRSIDEFCKPTEEGKEVELDTVTITNSSLEEAINSLHDVIGKLKTSVRSDFRSALGHPRSTEIATLYGRVRSGIYDELEKAVETDGVDCWCGNPGKDARGLNWHLGAIVRERLEAATATLTRSNERISVLYGATEGLEWMKAEILREAGGGGWFSLWPAKKKKALVGLLENFAAKKEEVLRESFLNIMTMLEIEYLAYVGSMDPVVRPLEFFSVQDLDTSSILRSIGDQANRIRAWLVKAAGVAANRKTDAISSLHEHAKSPLTDYQPPLTELLAADDSAGPVAARAIKRLSQKLVDTGKILGTIAEQDGKGPAQWRGVAPRAEDASTPLQDRFVSGFRGFVARELESDPELASIVRKPIKKVLEALGKDGQEELARRLSTENVAAFSLISDEARKRPAFRLLVTSDQAEGPGSLPAMMGYDPGSNQQDHYLDPDSQQRVLALKIYGQMYLESDFPWMSQMQHHYDLRLTYEPHLWRDGRVRVQRGGAEDRWRRGFALALAWAIIARQQAVKDPASPVRALFSAKLQNEPDSFLSEAPLALRDQFPHLLTIRLTESEHVTKDGRIEVRINRDPFERVAKRASSYGEAESAFLKRGMALENIELFHKWCAGAWRNWDMDGAMVVVPDLAARAQLFITEVDGTVVPTIEKKRKELEARANPSEEETASRQALGRVLTELGKEVEALRSYLAGTPTI